MFAVGVVVNRHRRNMNRARLATRCSSVNMEIHAAAPLLTGGANIWEVCYVIARRKDMRTGFDMNSMDGVALNGCELLLPRAPVTPRASLVICGVQQMHEPFNLGQFSRRRDIRDSVFNVCGRSRFAILHILKKKLLSGQVLGHVVGTHEAQWSSLSVFHTVLPVRHAVAS